MVKSIIITPRYRLNETELTPQQIRSAQKTNFTLNSEEFGDEMDNIIDKKQKIDSLNDHDFSTIGTRNDILRYLTEHIHGIKFSVDYLKDTGGKIDPAFVKITVESHETDPNKIYFSLSKKEDGTKIDGDKLVCPEFIPQPGLQVSESVSIPEEDAHNIFAICIDIIKSIGGGEYMKVIKEVE